VDATIDTDIMCEIIATKGKWIILAIVDGQVHFRVLGLTHNADFALESKYMMFLDTFYQKTVYN
jgi:dihydroorotase-like cyclic amidohydrolase